MEKINASVNTIQLVWNVNVACRFTMIDHGLERPQETQTNALVKLDNFNLSVLKKKLENMVNYQMNRKHSKIHLK